MSYVRTKSEYESQWTFLHVDDARRLGYIPFFGPVAILRDAWMVQNVINDILRNGRDRYCVVRFPSSVCEVWIYPNANPNHPHPYVHQGPEEKEENEAQ